MDISAQDAALTSGLHRLVQRLNQLPDDREPQPTTLGRRVAGHLGADPAALPLVHEDFPPHRLVDVDLALEALAAADPDAAVIGVAGGQERHHEDLLGMLQHRYASFGDSGPVEYTTTATGPATNRQTVAFGLRLLRYRGQPMAVLQRAANPRFGREGVVLEILSADPEATAAFTADVRRLMNQLSVVRGNVVSFAAGEYGQGIGRMAFLPRPEVEASDVILPLGLLAQIRDHVVGISEHAQTLRAAGQHLKRGVLLYGPPGTGKTLTVRHLLHETPGTTAVVLQGGSLALVSEAARLARVMTPSIVVLEDVDLVAAERGMVDMNPLLFEVLDALDGLDGDADVAFVLTTNRADVLEPALAARPGRVDLAVEIPLPDAAARRTLFRAYGGHLPVSGSSLDAAADRAEGVTASFAKELVRRAVLRATLAGRAATDDDLEESLSAMLDASAGISRTLFGGEDTGERMPGPGVYSSRGSFGSFGYVPLAHARPHGSAEVLPSGWEDDGTAGE